MRLIEASCAPILFRQLSASVEESTGYAVTAVGRHLPWERGREKVVPIIHPEQRSDQLIVERR